ADHPRLPPLAELREHRAPIVEQRGVTTDLRRALAREPLIHVADRDAVDPIERFDALCVLFRDSTRAAPRHAQCSRHTGFRRRGRRMVPKERETLQQRAVPRLNAAMAPSALALLPAFSLRDDTGADRSFPSGRAALICFVKEDCP